MSFKTFLTNEKHYDDEKVQQIIEFVEDNLLLSFLNSNFACNATSLFELTDIGALRSYHKKLAGTMRAQDMSPSGVRYSDVLEQYIKFLEAENRAKSKKALEAQKRAEKKQLKLEQQKKQQEERKRQEQDEREQAAKEAEQEAAANNDAQKLLEGKPQEKHILGKERNRNLRKRCIEHYGYRCQCCGIDFEREYGDAGKKFIEVHHLFPLSQTDGEHEVDPIKDLVPLCSNCHSMIHKGKEPGGVFKLEDLIRLYKGKKYEYDN